MNFFDAELSRDGEKYRARVANAVIDLPENRCALLSSKGRSTGKIILGIRPEHVNIVPRGAADSMRARVEVSEMMGSEVYLHVDIDGHDAVIRAQLGDSAAALDQTGMAAGGIVDFSFPGGLVHLFVGDGLNICIEKT